jgi:hypothetical protein
VTGLAVTGLAVTELPPKSAAVNSHI